MIWAGENQRQVFGCKIGHHLHRATLNLATLHCATLHCATYVLRCTAPSCTALHCITLHCTALVYTRVRCKIRHLPAVWLTILLLEIDYIARLHAPVGFTCYITVHLMKLDWQCYCYTRKWKGRALNVVREACLSQNGWIFGKISKGF